MSGLSMVVSAVLTLSCGAGTDAAGDFGIDAKRIGKAVSNAPISKISEIEGKGGIILAQKYGHEDPRGRDPKEENHDPRLPANKELLPANKHRFDHVAPDDVYGYKYPNFKEPY